MKKHSFVATLLVALFVLSLVMSPFSGVFAANGDHITLTSNVPTTTVNVAAGQQYSLDLTTCFNEPNSTHTLTYSLTGNNLGPHTKIAANIHNSNHQTFFFSEQNEGDYLVTITATCSDGDSASFDVYFKVTSGVPASSAQTNYDETNASSVTVYVTVSNDGMPIRGNDSNNTKLAYLPVEVPYFNLNLYGLQDYYRYPASGGNTVIQRPTLLHLYIYILERYYMGRPAADCGSGTSNDYNVFNYIPSSTVDVKYIDGTTAYNPYSNSKTALSVSGGAGSMYLTNFWGHDENLMYFRNHVFPVVSDGWGATADYILLSDNDFIDIAMFSNWDFYFSGAFLCFNSDAFVARTGISRTFKTMMFPASAYFGYGGSITSITSELDVDIYDSTWTKVADLTYTSGSNEYNYTFASAGTYYVVAKDMNAKGSSAYYAPAVAKVTVN